MATTLATKKQAEAIKQRMREIRTEIPYTVDDARDRVHQLMDWKYYVSRYPAPVLAGAVVLGYLLVPEKQSVNRPVYRQGNDAPETPAKRGVMSGIAAAMVTLAMRQGTALAARQLSNSLFAKNFMNPVMREDHDRTHP